MPVIDFDIAKKHVVSLLQASRTAYGAGTTGNAPDGSKRQFPSSNEIADAILEIDGEICTAICNTPGHPSISTFEALSSALVNGDSVPDSIGIITRVVISEDGSTYTDGKDAANWQDIRDMLAYPDRYGGASAILGWYNIRGSRIYTTSAHLKLYQATYGKTTSPQSPENYMNAVVAGAVSRLFKDGGDDQQCAYYGNIYAQMMQSITSNAE